MEMGNKKTLVHRAYDICSTNQYLEIELKHIQSSFNNWNGYPHWVVSRVFKGIKEKLQHFSNNAFHSYYVLIWLLES